MHVAQAHAQACVPALQACLEGSLLCHKLSVLPTIGMSMRFVECMMIMFGFRLSDKLMNVFAVFLCMCALMVILFFQAIGGKMDWPLPLYNLKCGYCCAHC